MPDPIRLSVLGYGMWTAAGHDGPSSVAAVHAGVAAAVESRLWDRTAGAELNVFQVSGHQWWQGETFLPEMAAEAVRQCHPQLTALGVEDVTTVPILIAVAPKDRPARTDSLEQALMSGLKALFCPLAELSQI